MSKHSFFLLSLLVASALAIPWHKEGRANEFPVSRHSSWMGSTQHNSKYHPSCEVAVAEGFRTATSTFDTSYVYICESSTANGICYFSALQKCCSTPADVDSLVSEQNFNIGDQKNVLVALHTSEQGVCVSFQNDNIEHCESSSRHFPPRCAAIIPGNRNIQSMPRCSGYGVCYKKGKTCRSCDEGFALPWCCDCVFNRRARKLYYYETTEDPPCLKICMEHTKNGRAVNCNRQTGCTECEEGYSKPTCCKKTTANTEEKVIHEIQELLARLD